MTILNLYYFTEIAVDLNLTTTSNRLFTTPQALSGHIKRLEEHYGAELFYRRQKLELTDAGRAILNAAKEILSIEAAAKQKLEMLSDRVSGSINVVCGLMRSRAYAPEILDLFNRKYPAVNVRLLNETEYRDKELFKNDDVDFLLSNVKSFNVGSAKVTSDFLLRNQSLAVISDALLRKYLGDGTSDFVKNACEGSGVNIDDLPIEIPVITTGVGSSSWMLDYYPNLRRRNTIFVDNSAVDVPLRMVRLGSGVLLITKMTADFIINNYIPDFLEEVYFLPLAVNGKKHYVDYTLTYRTDKPMPEYRKEFVQITKQVFQRIKDSGHYD